VIIDYIALNVLYRGIFQYLHFRINRYMIYKSIWKVKLLDTATLGHNHIVKLAHIVELPHIYLIYAFLLYVSQFIKNNMCIEPQEEDFLHTLLAHIYIHPS